MLRLLQQAQRRAVHVLRGGGARPLRISLPAAGDVNVLCGGQRHPWRQTKQSVRHVRSRCEVRQHPRSAQKKHIQGHDGAEEGSAASRQGAGGAWRGSEAGQLDREPVAFSLLRGGEMKMLIMIQLDPETSHAKHHKEKPREEESAGSLCCYESPFPLKPGASQRT